MKNFLVFVLLVCILNLYTAQPVNADSYPTPNNYVKAVTAAANTNGVQQRVVESVFKL